MPEPQDQQTEQDTEIYSDIMDQEHPTVGPDDLVNPDEFDDGDGDDIPDEGVEALDAS